jgi:hypothetical protein
MEIIERVASNEEIQARAGAKYLIANIQNLPWQLFLHLFKSEHCNRCPSALMFIQRYSSRMLTRGVSYAVLKHVQATCGRATLPTSEAP